MKYRKTSHTYILTGKYAFRNRWKCCCIGTNWNKIFVQLDSYRNNNYINRIMKEITIRDVAVAAGVAYSTVSRVLNQHPNVSPKIRNLVLSTVRRMGYSLNDQQHKTIAIIISGELTGYFDGITGALLKAVHSKGYRLELIPEQDIALINDRLIDGVISLEYNNWLNHYWNKCKSSPLVCINDYSVHFDNIYSVYSNERQGLALAVSYLINVGHRRIGFLVLDSSNYTSDLRKKSFLNEAAAAGLDAAPCYNIMRTNLHAAIEQISRDNLTAIIVSGEDNGIYLAKSLKENGYVIPRDISLISWEWDGVSANLSPAHTTIGQNFTEIAGQALNMLEKLMRREYIVNDYLIDYVLHERASVAAPPSS